MSLGSIERDVVNPEVTELYDYRGSLRLARIVEVYDASFLESAASGDKYKYGKVKILWLDGVGSVPKLLDVSKPWFSWKRGAAILSMPEKDDIIVCQSRPDGYPVILGFLPFKWDVASGKMKSDANDSVGSIRPLYSGEILLKSSAQAEVLLTKNGNIKLIAADPENSSNTVTDLEGNCTEQLFSRVNNKDSRVMECTFGYDPSVNITTNNGVGSSPQVCSIGTYSLSTISLSFPFSKEISFILNDDSVLDGISSIAIGKNEVNAHKNESIESTRYTLTSKNIYTPGSPDSSADTFNPCSLEKNSYLYTISFLDNVVHNDSDVVYITCNVKKLSGGMRINSDGDLFLDGRNIVLRSSNGKASLKLSEDGTTELRGVVSSIGGVSTGTVYCSDGGVMLSAGVGSGAQITNSSPASLLTGDTYFSVLDSYPLIKLSKSSGVWKFTGVTEEEYLSLSEQQRVSVNKLWISGKEELLTSKKLEELLSDGFPTYANLKSKL